MRGFRYLLVLFSVLILVACSEPPYNNVDNVGLKSMLNEGVPLYDIRRPEEWRQTGIVKGSKKLTFVDKGGRVTPQFFAEFTQSVDKHDPVLLICRTGNRSSVLARHLVENMGYTQVYNVRDGITRWISEREQVVRR